MALFPAKAKVPGGGPAGTETERPLKPLECSQVGLRWRVAQRVAVILNGGAWGDYLDTGPMVVPTADGGYTPKEVTGPEIVSLWLSA